MNKLDIQEIRKANLKLVIDQYAGGSVDKFSTDIEKHRTYVYAMLKGMGENNPRAVTSKMARFIEGYYGIPPLTLDNPNYIREIPGLAGEEPDSLIPEISFNFMGDKFTLNLTDTKHIRISSQIVPLKINGHTIYFYDAKDDLMAPKIEHPSSVLIEYFDNFSANDIISGAIYLVGYNKKIRLVRLFLEFNDKVKLKVDNPLKQNIFPEILIRVGEFKSSVQVFGKVVGNITFSEEFI